MTKSKLMKRGIIQYSIIGLYGIGMIIDTLIALSDVKSFGEQYIDARGLPVSLSILLVVLSVIGVISTIKKDRVANNSEVESFSNTTEERVLKKAKLIFGSKVFQIVLLTILFGFGVSIIGYFISSFVFTSLMVMILNDWDKKFFAGIFGLIVTVVLYFLFDVISVYFPHTLLF